MEQWNFTYWMGIVLLGMSLLLDRLSHRHPTANAIGVIGVICVATAFYLARMHEERN